MTEEQTTTTTTPTTPVGPRTIEEVWEVLESLVTWMRKEGITGIGSGTTDGINRTRVEVTFADDTWLDIEGEIEPDLYGGPRPQRMGLRHLKLTLPDGTCYTEE